MRYKAFTTTTVPEHALQHLLKLEYSWTGGIAKDEIAQRYRRSIDEIDCLLGSRDPYY